MARKLTALKGLLDEPPAPKLPPHAPQRSDARRPATAATDPTPQPQAPAQNVESAEEEQTVRSTLDLPVSRHAALLREAIDAGVDIGWSVRPQHILRAMYDVFIDDPDAIAKVREHIRQQGRPVRRRST